MIGATALEDLVSRLAWTLVIRLQSKGIITSDEVVGELEGAVSDVDGIRSSAFHEEISSCLREMLILLRERSAGPAGLAIEPQSKMRSA